MLQQEWRICLWNQGSKSRTPLQESDTQPYECDESFDMFHPSSSSSGSFADRLQLNVGQKLVTVPLYQAKS